MGWTKPKCLLEIAGRTLLDRCISAVLKTGVERVVLVVGYQRESIEAAVAASPYAGRVSYIVNPDFAETNTLHSLWLARGHFRDGFWLFNGDVIFDAEILTLLAKQKETALAIETKFCGEEEVKVIVDVDDSCMRIGKALDPSACAGEFVGIARFDGAIVPALVTSLNRHNATADGRDQFFEAAIDDLLDEEDIRAISINPLRAVEIDTPEDFERAAATFVSPSIP